MVREGGEKPAGGWRDFSEFLPGSVGATPWTARRGETSPKGDQARVESGRGEGDCPTIELAYLGGGKVRRASAWYGGNTLCQERTLRRIKALKSTPWLARGRCSLPIEGEVRAGRMPRVNPLDRTGRSPLSSPTQVEPGEDDVWRETEVRGRSSERYPFMMGEADGQRQGPKGRPVHRRNRKAGETTREQRISRDITADEEGNALKTKILWVDVARNRATRPEWEKAAGRVRNPVGGWRSRGKAATLSLVLIPPKGTEPQGRSRR